MRNPFAPHALAVSLMLSRDERHLCLSSLSLSSGPLCTAHVLRVREGRYRRLRAEVGGGAGVGRCAVVAQKREAEEAPLSASLSKPGPKQNPSLLCSLFTRGAVTGGYALGRRVVRAITTFTWVVARSSAASGQQPAGALSHSVALSARLYG